MLNVRDLIPWSRREVAPGRQEFDHPFLALQREMERVFDEFWRGFDVPAFGRLDRSLGALAPRMDVAEDEKAIRVTVELPGMSEEDVEVLFSDHALTIRGEKKVEHEEGEKGYTYRERSYGSFRRTLPIDVEVMEDALEARFAKGVLTITLPKAPGAESKVKKVPVIAEGKAEAKAETKGEAKAA